MTRWQDYETKTDNVKPWEELIINSWWIVKRVDANKFKWVPWERWPAGERGPAGERWEPFKFSDFTEEQLKNLKWVWIKKIIQRKNWKITTVTVELTDSSSFDFEISDWADWAGSGDLISSNNLSDLIDKVKARENLNVYSKTESDKKLDDEIKKIPQPDLTNYIQKEKWKWLFSGNYNDLENKPTIPNKNKIFKNEWDRVLLLSNVDLNTVVIPWFYRVDWGINKPDWSSHWLYLEVFSHDNSHTLQRATELDWENVRIYIRHKHWTSQWDRWSPWRRINTQLLWGWIAKNTHNWTLVIGNSDNNTWITEVENWAIGFYVKWEYVAAVAFDWLYSNKPQAPYGNSFVRKDYVDSKTPKLFSFRIDSISGLEDNGRLQFNHNLWISKEDWLLWRYRFFIDNQNALFEQDCYENISRENRIGYNYVRFWIDNRTTPINIKVVKFW